MPKAKAKMSKSNVENAAEPVDESTNNTTDNFHNGEHGEHGEHFKDDNVEGVEGVEGIGGDTEMDTNHNDGDNDGGDGGNGGNGEAGGAGEVVIHNVDLSTWPTLTTAIPTAPDTEDGDEAEAAEDDDNDNNNDGEKNNAVPDENDDDDDDNESDDIANMDLTTLPNLSKSDLSHIISSMLPNLTDQELLLMASQVILSRKMRQSKSNAQKWATRNKNSNTAHSIATPKVPKCLPPGVVVKDPSLIKHSFDRKWEQHYQELVQFKINRGHCNIKPKHNLPKLWHWIRSQRMRKSKQTLAPDRIQRLDVLGFAWRSKDAVMLNTNLSDEEVWNARYNELRTYFETHGNLDLPVDYPSVRKLYMWMMKQRRLYKQSLLPLSKINLLNQIKFPWTGTRKPPKKVSREQLWHLRYNQMKEFQTKYGHCRVPKAYKGEMLLHVWAGRQRVLKRKGILSEDRVELLNGIGFHWRKEDVYLYNDGSRKRKKGKKGVGVEEKKDVQSKEEKIKKESNVDTELV